MTSHRDHSINEQIKSELARVGALACEPSPETLRLEMWCRLGSDIALGFAIGFVTIAAWTW